MAAKGSADSFANYAIISVLESAANTLTFKKLETGISLNEKVAWVINRLEYLCDSLTNSQMAQEADSIQFGLSLSNAFSVPTLTEQTVIDYNYFQKTVAGTPADEYLIHQPSIKDFSQMPGGGIIVPPTPLYLWAKGNGLGAAATVVCRIHYTLLELAVDQYWQLVEARRVLSS